jgi:hypothetical protein
MSIYKSRTTPAHGLGAKFFNALLKPSAAMRAKRVTGWQVLAAEAACLDLALNRGCRFRPELGDGPLTPVAPDDRFSGLDFEDGDEKEAQVMVHAFVIGLVQAADRAAPGLLIQDLDLGRDAGDEKEEGVKHASKLPRFADNFAYLQVKEVILMRRFDY